MSEPAVITDEELLWEACTEGSFEAVISLSQKPEIDVNWRDPIHRRTPFYRACSHNRAVLVEYLLKDPRFDVNMTQNQGGTPLNISCQDGLIEVVRMLLKDPRPLANVADIYGATPLWVTCQNGNLEILKLLLFYRAPELDTKMATVVGPNAWNNRTPLEIAELKGKSRVVRLLREYESDPAEVLRTLRKEYRIQEIMAGELLALVVYYCDEYLQVPLDVSGEGRAKVAQFFRLAARLPFDLQMVLCNRTYDLAASTVPRKDSEHGFRVFAKQTWQ